MRECVVQNHRLTLDGWIWSLIVESVPQTTRHDDNTNENQLNVTCIVHKMCQKQWNFHKSSIDKSLLSPSTPLRPPIPRLQSEISMVVEWVCMIGVYMLFSFFFFFLLLQTLKPYWCITVSGNTLLAFINKSTCVQVRGLNPMAKFIFQWRYNVFSGKYLLWLRWK